MAEKPVGYCSQCGKQSSMLSRQKLCPTCVGLKVMTKKNPPKTKNTKTKK